MSDRISKEQAADEAERATQVVSTAVKDALREAGFDLNEVKFMAQIGISCEGGYASGVMVAGVDSVMEGVMFAVETLQVIAENEVIDAVAERIQQAEQARRN